MRYTEMFDDSLYLTLKKKHKKENMETYQY